jgi:choice-of-anchor A domain-containing protein
MAFGLGNVTSSRKPAAMRVVVISVLVLGFSSAKVVWADSDLGNARSFAVLSSTGDVTFKNRVTIRQVGSVGAACPGSVGCPGDVAGTTVLMGRGNAASPDLISGDVIASANSSQGLNCSGNPPGTTAICLGNDSEVAGVCATGGGTISAPAECAGGTDTSGGHPDLTTLYPQANTDAVAFSTILTNLAVTQTLSAITLSTRGSLTISGASGQNVISVPSITTGTKSTITIHAGATDTVVVNVGSPAEPGSLQLGNDASIVLSGGITPDRIIFNLIGSGTTAQLGNDTTFNGTILAPQGEFTSGDGNKPSPVLINGALLFGGGVSLGNNTNLNFYPFGSVSGGGGTTSSTASQI